MRFISGYNKRENVSLIINGSSHADVLCLMSSIKVKIASCPLDIQDTATI